MTTKLRPLVPVLGTGFNRWLLQGTDASPMLTDWWALLRLTARAEGVAPDSRLDARLRHGFAPTFAWETLLHEVAAGKKTIGGIEEQALARLAGRIGAAESLVASRPVVAERVDAFWKALSADGTYGELDVLSLNFDRLTTQAWQAKPLTEESDSAGTEGAPKVSRATIPARHFVDHSRRVWHPHGHITAPQTMVVGTHRYSRSATHVFEAFRAYRKAIQDAGHDVSKKRDDIAYHNQHRSDTSRFGPGSWVAAALNAPLLLIGVGLSRDETDLWEFLHLRARNHSGVKPGNRPPIWRFTCNEELAADRKHWESLSAAIEVRELNLGDTWAEAWANLLVLLATPTTIWRDPA